MCYPSAYQKVNHFSWLEIHSQLARASAGSAENAVIEGLHKMDNHFDIFITEIRFSCRMYVKAGTAY